MFGEDRIAISLFAHSSMKKSKKEKMQEITIQNRRIGTEFPPLVIAEVGINHEGEYKKAVELVDAAVEAGAECIKFQCHITEAEMVPTNMTPGDISDEKLWDIIKRCELTGDEDSKAETAADEDTVSEEDTDTQTESDTEVDDESEEVENISGVLVEVPEELRTPEIPAALPVEDEEETAGGQPGISDSVNPDDIVEVSVVALHTTFKTDHEAAEELFKNKVLRVTGLVGRIIINDIVDNPCLILTGEDKTTSMRNVICLFDKSNEDELKKLSVDQVVVVEGVYDSYTINILLTHCRLIR